MRFKILVALAAFALAPPLAAQHAQRDSALASAVKSQSDTIFRDRSRPAYVERARLRLVAISDSLKHSKPDTVAGGGRVDTVTIVRVDTVYVQAPPVTPVVASVVIDAPATTLLVGKTLQLTAHAKDANGVVIPSAPITWGTTTPTIATLSSAGLLAGKAAGNANTQASSGGVSGARIFVVQDTATTAPPDTIVPIPPSGSGIAAQPANVPVPLYPTCTSTVQVAAGASFQAALNSAQGGTCLVLAQANFVGNFQLPNRTSSGYVTITSSGFVSQPGVRMTPSRAPPLAKILSPNYTEAIGASAGAHGYIFRGVEIGTTSAAQATSMNVLVRLTDPTNAAPPHDIQFQQIYAHGTPTLDMRRAFRADAKQVVLVDSWIDEIHSNNSDSQAWLAISCAQGHLVQNNTLKAGHEIVMFGGGDPPNAGCIPQDIVLRQNHIYHPQAWYKVWQVKNCIETKNVLRYLIEANVIENCWPDAQAGFAFVMKSENQDGSAPFTTTSDVTIRYNRVNSIGNGFNLSGKGSNGNPNQVASRFDIHDNVFTNFTDQAIEVQFLSSVTDVQLRHNTFYGKNAGGSGMSFDGGPAAVRLVVDSIALHANAYGVKGSGLSAGTATLNAMAPGWKWHSVLLVGDGNCGPYPATTVCVTSFPSLPVPAYGADTSKVNALTKGVVVSDPLVASLSRHVPRRNQLRYAWPTTSPACQKPLARCAEPPMGLH